VAVGDDLGDCEAFMTWKEFKEAVESQGVRDDTVIDYIDYSTDIWERPKVTFSPERVFRVDSEP